MTRQEFAEFVAALERRLAVRFDRLEQAPAVGFGDVQRDVRLSFEAVEALRQQMDRRFDETRQNQCREIALTLDVLRQVRRRVDRMEGLRD